MKYFAALDRLVNRIIALTGLSHVRPPDGPAAPPSSAPLVAFAKDHERRAAPGFSTHAAIGEFGPAEVFDFHNPPPAGYRASTRRGFSRPS